MGEITGGCYCGAIQYRIQERSDAGICYCENCRRGMRAQGVDVHDEEAVFLYSVHKWKSFQAQCVALMHHYHPEASIYFNGTTKLNTPNRNVAFKMYEHNTQQDLAHKILARVRRISHNED